MALGRTNFNDPRFQRQLLKSGGLAGQRGRRAASEITGDFVANQLRTDLEFAHIFDRRKSFRDNLALREKGLGLQERKMKFQDKMFDKRMKGEREGLIVTTAAGLGGGVLGFFQGRERAKAAATERKKAEAHRGRVETIFEESRPKKKIEEFRRAR